MGCIFFNWCKPIEVDFGTQNVYRIYFEFRIRWRSNSAQSESARHGQLVILKGLPVVEMLWMILTYQRRK